MSKLMVALQSLWDVLRLIVLGWRRWLGRKWRRLVGRVWWVWNRVKRYCVRLWRALTGPLPQGMTMAQRYRAIKHVRDPAKLDTMWRIWEEGGQSQEGLLYAAVLQRRAELGVPLTLAEKDLLTRIEQQREQAKSLPPVRGRLKL